MRPHLSSKQRRAAAVTMSLLLPLAAVTVNAATAQASSPCNPISCVWDYGSNSAPIECISSSCGGFGFGTVIREGNGGQFTMDCWFDGSSYTGNYTSKRWFEGFPVGLSGLWLIHSSYVYNQTIVGPC